MKSSKPTKSITGVSPRPEVERMQGYKAPLEGRRNLLRLDFNENTLGPSPHVVEALRNIPSHHISIYIHPYLMYCNKNYYNQNIYLLYENFFYPNTSPPRKLYLTTLMSFCKQQVQVVYPTQQSQTLISCKSF